MRTSLKITGASGQGINSVGEIVAKTLKREGYCVFGYREYPSLIKGGHASYQLDISPQSLRSTETKVDILLAFNHHAFEHNLPDMKQGGIFIHSTPNWKFTSAQKALVEERGIRFIEVPIDSILKSLDAKPILANIVLTAFVWAILKQDAEALKAMVGEKFAKKQDLLALNMRCIEEGMAYHAAHAADLHVTLGKPVKKWTKYLLLTGSEAMGLGVVHAGVRLYAGYPMTPSSPLLSYLAAIQNETGMVIKQAEDEITAAQMVSGAMFAGTRALTATSGGGFDLMSETLSLNAIIENPTVFVLAQRPGPATGLPTWTGQGDLLMAIFTGHGEFPRCVLSVSDSQDCFDLMNEAFSIAEEYQISVIVLTDKQIAEALYTQEPYDVKKAVLRRGKLITEKEALTSITASDRYNPSAHDGVSPRWLPGSCAATYCAQGDEHSGEGTVDESSANAIAQMQKRMRKHDALVESLPEPELHGPDAPHILLIGWGSTKDVVLDALKSEAFQDMSIGYLHYTYLWPLKTARLLTLLEGASDAIVIEGNFQGQLGKLIRQETGRNITDHILKYDGRPFFVDELTSRIAAFIESKRSTTPTP